MKKLFDFVPLALFAYLLFSGLYFSNATFIGLFFILSLYILIKSSDYFTDSAERIGLHFGIPAFIVGVTIVSIGTSLPELVSSIVAVFKGTSEIVIGNVVGSNIANIFLVLGVAAIIIKKLKITYEIAHVDLPLLVGSAILLAVTVWDGNFNIFDSIICLTALLVYFLYTINVDKDRGKDKEAKKSCDMKRLKCSSFTYVTLVLSSFFIYAGAKYTVDSVIELSGILNLGVEIIAVSAVALGTSLPELMVTISAARKGSAEIAVGNVLGSNIFNALAVMGVPALLGTLTVPANIISFSLPMMLVATLLFFFVTRANQVTKYEGWLLLLFYVFFIGKLFGYF